MAKFYFVSNQDGLVIFDCPGCECSHFIKVKPQYPQGWEFNGDLDNPTVSPSILVNPSGNIKRCHSFIKDGKIQYLNDCEHSLKGQTIELPDTDGQIKHRS